MWKVFVAVGICLTLIFGTVTYVYFDWNNVEINVEINEGINEDISNDDFDWNNEVNNEDILFDEFELTTVLEALEFIESNHNRFNLSRDFVIVDIHCWDGQYGKYLLVEIVYANKTKPFNNTNFLYFGIFADDYNNNLSYHQSDNFDVKGTYLRGVKQIPLKNPTYNLDCDEALQIALNHPRFRKFYSNGMKYGYDPEHITMSAFWLPESYTKYNEPRFAYIISEHYTSDKTYNATFYIDIETGEMLYVEIELEDTVEETDGNMKYYITGTFVLILIVLLVILFRKIRKKESTQ